MKKSILIACAGMFFSTYAMAALSPYYQSKKEIKEILSNTKIDGLFSNGRAIISIVKVENGYDISSDTCSLHVGIKYLPRSGGVVGGPARFELVIPQQINCP